MNIYFIHEINLWAYTQGVDFTLRNFLFGVLKLTKNADFEKYKYSGYGTDGIEFGKNVIIFGDDMQYEFLCAC